VQVINYRNPKYLQSNRFLACLKGVIESLLGLFPPLRFRYGQTFKHFLSEAISQSRLYTSSDEIKKDALSYSTIVSR